MNLGTLIEKLHEFMHLPPTLQNLQVQNPPNTPILIYLGIHCLLYYRIPRSALHPELVWVPHTESKPCYLRIENKLKMANGRLNEANWEYLNRVIKPQEITASPGVTPATSGCSVPFVGTSQAEQPAETTQESFNIRKYFSNVLKVLITQKNKLSFNPTRLPALMQESSGQSVGLLEEEVRNPEAIPSVTPVRSKRPSTLSLSSTSKSTSPKIERRQQDP